MAVYSYSARDQAGKLVKGTVDAASEKEAANLLRERGLLLTRISQGQNTFSVSMQIFNGVSFNDIVSFTRQLSTMVTAGLQLQDALSLLKQQTKKPAMNDMILSISREIQSGGSLASALEKYPKQFSLTYLSLIKAGESSGTLDKVLNRLADNMEKDQEFRSKVKGALIYPIIIVIAMVAVFAILMIFVVPKLTDLYAGFGSDLPLQTKILQWVSDFSVHFWWIVLLFSFLAWVVFRKWKKTYAGRHIWDAFMLKIPILGPLRKQIILVEFTRTLGLLVGAGVHILDSLNILIGALGNVHYEEALKEIAKKVEKGFPLGQLFAQYEMFPPILAQMIKVGEETGKMDDSLLRLANYFERESDNTVKALTTAIEPAIMVVLGIGVGFIVFAIITPLYNLTSIIK